MINLSDALNQWVEKQKYTYSLGEWFKGKSTKAISTDKLAELVPQTIREEFSPKEIKEQLNKIADSLNEDDDDEEVISGVTLEDIAKIGVSNSIFSVGDKTITLELRGYANVPNAIDARLMERIVYAHESDNNPMCFLKSEHESGCFQYTHIEGSSLDLDVETCMIKSRQFAKIQEWFENQLIEWEHEIVRIWNMNVKYPHNKIQDYVLANIPVTLISNCAISIICSEKNVGEDETGEPMTVLVAHGVKWGTKSNQKLQYSDFVKMNIASYKTTSLVELTQMPKVYGNAGQDAMNVFDIKPYFKGEPVELSPEWQEVKSKYTEDEWSVLCAWTVAVLDAGNTGRQSLAQIDYDGYSGKSVYSDVLIRFLGLNNCAAIGKGSLSNQFWASKMWNKRLIVSDDNKNPKLNQTEAVHCVLGGGYADVEYKGERSFAWKMSSKLLVNSNVDLDVNGSMLHERSRVIILKPKMPKELVTKLSAKDENGNVILDQNGNVKLIGDPKFADNLLNTIDTFLRNAVKYYKKLCPNRADIIIPNSILEHVYSSESPEETMFNSILKRAFDVTGDSNDTMTQSEFMERYMEITKGVKIYNQYASPQEYGNFKLFIKKVHKIEASGKKRLFSGIKVSGTECPNPEDTSSQFYKPKYQSNFGSR